MDTASTVTIIAAALSSTVLVKVIELVSNIINKKRTKESQLDRIENKVKVIKDDLDEAKIEECRTNLMLLLHGFRDSNEIPILGEQYVSQYNGNSYIIPLLVSWYDEKSIAYPDWLKEAYDKHCQHALKD